MVAFRYYQGMSTLKFLVEREGVAALDRIHEQTGINRKYLHQIATNRRRPSAALARLTLEGLLFNESGAPHVEQETA